MDCFALTKSPADSEEQLKVPALPSVLNSLGHVKSGYALKMMDIAAVLPVLRHLGLGAGYGVVTAGVDRTNFIEPIKRWEIMTLTSRLTQVWNTSAETEVTITATSFRTGDTRHIATANMVMVALDKRRQKFRLPELDVSVPADTIRQQAAEARKKARLLDTHPSGLFIQPEWDDPICEQQKMTLHEANLFNQVFGGVVLEIMETAGRTAAKRHVLGGAVEGVRLDRMSFLSPAFIGETIQAYALVTQTWLTSMEVQVEVFAFNERLPQPRKIAQAYLVYVGLDPDGAPTMVPTWQPASDVQVQRAEAANTRRAQRKAEDKTPVNT